MRAVVTMTTRRGSPRTVLLVQRTLGDCQIDADGRSMTRDRAYHESVLCSVGLKRAVSDGRPGSAGSVLVGTSREEPVDSLARLN